MTMTKTEMAEIALKENRFMDAVNLYSEASLEAYRKMTSSAEYKELMARLAELNKEHDEIQAKSMDAWKKRGEFQAKVVNSRPLGNLVANKQYIEAACCEEFREAVTSEPDNYEILRDENGYYVSVFHVDGDYYTKSERCPFCGGVIHMKNSMGS